MRGFIRAVGGMINFLVAILTFPLTGMAALTADRDTRSKEQGVKGYPVAASTTIYKGGLVALNASGYLVMAADTAGLRVIGVADEACDNSAGSNGTKECKVLTGRAFRFAASSITQAHVGQMMYVVDSQTFDDGGGAENKVPCGILVEYDATTAGWIYIPEGGPAAFMVLDGAEQSLRVINETGSAITAGQIVYVSGWDETEDAFNIVLADSDAQGLNDDLWVLRSDIANNAVGLVHRTYRLTGQNTSAAGAEGDAVYLSTTAGGYVISSPIDGDPNGKAIIIGYVAVDHASTGEVQFKLPGRVVQIGTNEIQDGAVTSAKTTNMVAGVAGYKLARGVHTTAAAVDTVVTGLATVVAVVVSYSTDPADANFLVSATIGDQAGSPAAGSIYIKSWKHDGADPTPTAATSFSKAVNWIAIGT